MGVKAGARPARSRRCKGRVLSVNQNMSDEELENLAPWSPKVQKCCVNKIVLSIRGNPDFSGVIP